MASQNSIKSDSFREEAPAILIKTSFCIPVFTEDSGSTELNSSEICIAQSLHCVKVSCPDRLRDLLGRSRVDLIIISTRLTERLRRRLQESLRKFSNDFSTMVYWRPERSLIWTLQPIAVFFRRLKNGPICRLGIALQKHVLLHLTDQDLSVARLAKDMNMSISRFYLRVKTATGYSPNRYVRLLRMERAQQLLLDPLLSIGDVAYAIGILDVSYFSRLFRMEYGNSPSCWRKIQLGSRPEEKSADY